MEENNDSSKLTTLIKARTSQTKQERQKKTQDKQTRNRQMETHPTQKDSKLQRIH